MSAVRARTSASQPDSNRLLVAVEGPVRAGKSTLCASIARAMTTDVVLIADYADVVGAENLPRPVPRDVDEDRRSINTLLDVDRRRLGAARGAWDTAGLALIDRSILTLCAHRAGLDSHFGQNRFADAGMRVLRDSQEVVWPSAVIYLDLPQEELLSRHAPRPMEVYTDPSFNHGYRLFFDKLRHTGEVPMLWLDAAGELEGNRQRAIQFLKSQDSAASSPSPLPRLLPSYDG